MSWQSITFVILAIVTLAFAGVWRATKHSKEPFGKGLTITFASLSLVMLLFASVAFVGTKNVGIVTTFGRPSPTTLSNGAHLIAPWQKVSQLDGSVQTENFTAGDGNLGCREYRIGDDTLACVSYIQTWSIVDEEGASLLQEYRGFGKIRENLVLNNGNVAMSRTMESFDPMFAAASSANSTDPGAESEQTHRYLEGLSDAATEELQGIIGDRIQVTIAITLVDVGEVTEKRLSDFRNELANTRTATQHVQTAEAEAEANRILAESATDDPGVLTLRCLQMVNRAIDEGYPLPAGFQCIPGSGAAIVVPSAPAEAQQ